MPAGTGAAFGNFLLVAVIFLTVATLVGVFMLRIAIAIYNRIASVSNRVPVPGYKRAALITFITVAVQWVGREIVVDLVDLGIAMTGSNERVPDFFVRYVSLPLGFFAMVLLMTALLPTTFVRALLVTLCDWLLTLAIAVVLLG